MNDQTMRQRYLEGNFNVQGEAHTYRSRTSMTDGSFRTEMRNQLAEGRRREATEQRGGRPNGESRPNGNGRANGAANGHYNGSSNGNGAARGDYRNSNGNGSGERSFDRLPDDSSEHAYDGSELSAEDERELEAALAFEASRAAVRPAQTVTRVR